MSMKTLKRPKAPFWQRVRDLFKIARCWFNGSQAMYEVTFVHSGPGTLSRVVRLRPEFDSFRTDLVHGKSVKFMTDFRLISTIPKPLWSSPSMVVTNSRFVNASTDLVSNTEEPVEFLGDYQDAESANGADVPAEVDEDNVGLVASASLKNPAAAQKPYRPSIEPKAVFEELQTVPSPINMEGLDAKLEILQKTIGLIRVERAGGNQNTAHDVIERVRNRIQYRDNIDARTFFDAFKNTTDAHITALLQKHKHLRIGPVDDFLVEMPDSAKTAMLDYAEWTVRLFQMKPVFYIIAKADDFARAQNDRERRDPILLVQSPFGFYWQILGAWGAEEMLAVDEL